MGGSTGETLENGPPGSRLVPGGGVGPRWCSSSTRRGPTGPHQDEPDTPSPPGDGHDLHRSGRAVRAAAAEVLRSRQDAVREHALDCRYTATVSLRVCPRTA